MLLLPVSSYLPFECSSFPVCYLRTWRFRHQFGGELQSGKYNTAVAKKDYWCWKWPCISQSETESESRSVVSNSLQPHGLSMNYSMDSPWNSLGQNTGMSSLSLLQGIFPTQGLNPGLPHYRRILYQLSHKGSPKILEWVACSFSSGSSWPRNRTGVSCIAGGFFTNWAIREALIPKGQIIFCTVMTYSGWRIYY